MSSYYSFTSFLRKGLANSIQGIDDPAKTAASPSTVLARPSVDATVYVKFDELAPEALRKTLDLYSPANVSGIDLKSIIRTVPEHYCTNAEPNYLASIDFYEEDFPWRFTPTTIHTTAAGEAMLTPWLALVVLKEDEFEAVQISAASAEGQPLPFFKLTAAAQASAIFAPMEELHFWAHVHSNADISSNPNSLLQQQLDEDGDNCFARIICPRRLDANTSYHAFLIPSFETGRLAGMGNFDAAESTSVNAGSYSNGQTDFPYYHRWYFATGNMGDFEFLARQLQPKPSGSEVGYRALEVPGISKPLQLPGCLRVPLNTLETTVKNQILDYEKWAGNTPHIWQQKTAKEIELTIGNDADPVVARPMYGRWHAKQGANRPWLDDLNLDPRYRGIAALGVEAVQKNQETLMDAAWEQVEAIREANKKIRLAQLAIQVNKRFEKRVLNNFSEEQLIQFTIPLHKKINALAGISATLHQTVAKSAVPLSTNNNLFRRVTRSMSPLAKLTKQSSHLFSDKNRLLDAMNKNNIKSFQDKIAPSGFISDSRFTELVNSKIKKSIGFTGASLADRTRLMNMLEGAVVYNKDFQEMLKKPGTLVNYQPVNTTFTPRLLSQPMPVAQPQPLQPIRNLRPVTGINRQPVERFPVTGPGTLPVRIPVEPDLIRVNEPIIPVKSVFVQAMENTATVLNWQDEFPEIAPVPLNIPAIKQQLTNKLHPMPLFRQWVGSIYPGLFVDTLEEEEWFEPVMKYPEFHIPAYQFLVEKSTEFFLPNINKIETNSVTLLETNQAFIEAYIAGLNYEFSRELLWRGYPTDQRGSYFRLFWDGVTNRYDINEMHTWNKALGFNNQERTDNYLVLVLRGDLLKKFPHTVIGVQKAGWKNNDVKVSRELKENSEFILPIFEAYIQPDLFFIGFNLKEEDLIGAVEPTNSSADPGYFFVLKERPGEPRFGLDEGAASPSLSAWNNLTWADLATQPNQTVRFNGAALTATISRTGDDQQAAFPPANAAQLAYLLYQQPVLIAIHAAQLLIKK